ncbi:DUF4236 domain-containing protein [Mycobacterium sp. NPDC048908]|uniref:DUF4236 domain-containing protein n=1 Tax=Mycobacterium sp. NPDC048908 TaxID=3364292 RepID=UPI003710950B
MGFGLSFKVAPGVRIRASSRGVRTSIGPRAARIHVGGGRTRVSSGFGPLTVSTVAGSGGRSSRSGRRQNSYSTVNLAALQRQAAAAERAEAIESVMRLEHSLLTLHLEDFAPATRPVLPEPAAPDLQALVDARKRQALEGVSVFDRAKRKEAQQWAENAGRHDADVQWEQVKRTHAEQQTLLAEQWNKLIAHDPEAVHLALEEAFEDNQSPAACLDVGKDISTDTGVRFATVLILFGPVDLVPERRPALTPSGQPTLHKRTKTERNDFYVRALGSTVLATVKEGLAVAPSITELRIVVLRKDPQATTPSGYVEWIYAARYPRAWTAALPWQSLDPAEVLLKAPQAKMLRKGAAGNIVGLLLDDEPGLSAIVDSVREAV